MGFNCPYLMSGIFIKGTEIYPCCYVNPFMTRESIIEYDETVYNNKMLRNIRKEAQEGVPRICKACMEKEDKTGRSPRTVIEAQVKKHGYPYKDVQEYTDPNDITYCHIRLSNVCNYKCTICFPSNSHLIAKEMGRKAILNQIDENYYESLVNDLNQFNALKYIRLSGGETLFMKKELIKLLTKLDKRFTICITTNGSVFDEEINDVLKDFSQVIFTFSIDGMGKFFEYQRTNGDWNSVYENLKKYNKLGLPFVSPHFNTTVTNVILPNIPDFLRFTKNEFSNFLDGSVFNLIKSPDYYQVKLIKDEYLESIADEIENIHDIPLFKNLATDIRAEIGQTIQANLITKFWLRADYIKKYRGINIKDLGIDHYFKT